MDETFPTPHTDTEYKAAFEQIMADIDATFRQMDTTRAETLRLRNESRMIQTRTDTKMEELKMQMERLWGKA